MTAAAISSGDFYFDEEAANDAVYFIEEYCRHMKGPLAGQKLLLREIGRTL